MKRTMYVLLADNARAKVYKTDFPITAVNVVYDQVNFNAQHLGSVANPLSATSGRSRTVAHEIDAYIRSLSKFLQAGHKAGKFTFLVMLGDSAVLSRIYQQLDTSCRNALLASEEGISIRTGAQELVQLLQEIFGMQNSRQEMLFALE